MQFKELINLGLWDSILLNSNLPFLSDIGVKRLSDLSILTYGERLVYDSFSNVEVNVISDLIIINFLDKWNSFNDALTSIDFTNDSISTTSGDIEKTEVKNSTNVTLNKLSSFNDDSLITDNSNELNVNDDVLDTERKEVIVTTKNGVNSIKNLKIKYDNDIIKIVLEDVSRFLTLNIY